MQRWMVHSERSQQGDFVAGPLSRLRAKSARASRVPECSQDVERGPTRFGSRVPSWLRVSFSNIKLKA